MHESQTPNLAQRISYLSYFFGVDGIEATEVTGTTLEYVMPLWVHGKQDTHDFVESALWRTYITLTPIPLDERKRRMGHLRRLLLI